MTTQIKNNSVFRYFCKICDARKKPNLRYISVYTETDFMTEDVYSLYTIVGE
jgi:hypothetical protein